MDDFRARDCEVLAVSVDSQFSHFAWKQTALDKGGIGNVQFPMVSDLNKSISRDYGVLLEDGIALRGLFIVDRDGIIRHELVNDLPIGRNIDEILRTIDAIQFHQEQGDVCPANWAKGKEAMKPTAEGVAEYISRNYGGDN